jgi:formylglycine-generating enzyme required for sulfatase activity
MGQLSSKSPGFEQTDDHPVVCVNIREIRSYFAWLNSRTGAKPAYRLPSDAEWFYAAMAGTGDVDPWGDDRARACEYANVYDSTAAAGKPDKPAAFACTDGYAFSAPVGRFKANAWGVHDTMGNVAEWLQDCGRREPQAETCNFRVVAGGHYYETLKDDRRYRIESTDDRKNSTGFRVARFL